MHIWGVEGESKGEMERVTKGQRGEGEKMMERERERVMKGKRVILGGREKRENVGRKEHEVYYRKLVGE